MQTPTGLGVNGPFALTIN